MGMSEGWGTRYGHGRVREDRVAETSMMEADGVTKVGKKSQMYGKGTTGSTQ